MFLQLSEYVLKFPFTSHGPYDYRQQRPINLRDHLLVLSLYRVDILNDHLDYRWELLLKVVFNQCSHGSRFLIIAHVFRRHTHDVL